MSDLLIIRKTPSSLANFGLLLEYPRSLLILSILFHPQHSLPASPKPAILFLDQNLHVLILLFELFNTDNHRHISHLLHPGQTFSDSLLSPVGVDAQTPERDVRQKG